MAISSLTQSQFKDLISQWYSSRYGAAATCALLSLILYCNTLTAEFVYDDSRAIVNNHDLRSKTPWGDLLVDDFWGTPLAHSGSHKSYRPLTVATFRLNYLIGALNPFGYHLVNVLLHCVVSALFCIIVRHLSTDMFVVWSSGLLFVVHPIHTEAVAGVVGRADLLATLFALIGFHSYLNYKRSRSHSGHLLGTALCALLAMLAKEQGITLVGVCVVYDLLLLAKKMRRHLRWQTTTPLSLLHQVRSMGLVLPWSIFSLSAFALLAFRFWIMGLKSPEFSPSDNPAAHADHFLTRLFTFVYLPLINLKLLIMPSTLSFDWSMDSIQLVESVTDPRNLMSVVLYAFVGYICVKLLNVEKYLIYDENKSPKRKKLSPALEKYDINGNPYFDYGSDSVSQFACTSNGCSNLQCTELSSSGFNERQQHLLYKSNFRGSPLNIDIGEHVADRLDVNLFVFGVFWMVVTFLPATNLLFYVGFVVAERVLYLPSVGYCVAFAYGANMLKNYCKTTRISSSVSWGLILVLVIFSAKTVLRNGDWANEESLYKSGIATNPAKAYSNLGNVLSKNKRMEESELAYKAAIARRSNMADTHYNLGILLQEQGKWEEALRSYENAIRCRQRLAVAHLNLGIVLNQMNRKPEAEARYKVCSQLSVEGLKDPKTHENAKLSCLYNLGRMQLDQERNLEATETFQLAVQRLNPYYRPHSLYNMLGEAYSKLNDQISAEKWFRASLAAKPDHVPAHLTYGHLLLKKGSKTEALHHFQKAVDFNPHDVACLQHLGQYYFEVDQFEMSEKFYSLALKVDENNFDTVFSLANIYRHLNRNDDAEKFYWSAVRIRPSSSNAHMNLGAILHLNKKYHDAELSYMKALELSPDDSTTKENLRKLRNLKK